MPIITQALDIKLIGGVHMWWFPNSIEFGLKGLSPNHSKGSPLPRLGPNQV